MAAPQIPVPTSPAGKWQREYQAFLRLLPELLATHRDQYVVIHEGKMVDSGSDDIALAMRFFAQHGNVPIHVGLVTDREVPPLRVPHYREIARPTEGM
jgi:hypothetical protein